MGQLGVFDADKRLAAISAKGDPLEMIDRVVPFESLRSEIEAVVKSTASGCLAVERFFHFSASRRHCPCCMVSMPAIISAWAEVARHRRHPICSRR
jgi:hypothetical protein